MSSIAKAALLSHGLDRRAAFYNIGNIVLPSLRNVAKHTSERETVKKLLFLGKINMMKEKIGETDFVNERSE